MEVVNRKSISEYLKEFDYCSAENTIIEITQWTNEEGWDIDIDGKAFSITRGELEAINYLTKALELNKPKDGE